MNPIFSIRVHLVAIAFAALAILPPPSALAWHVDTNTTTDTTRYVPLKPTDILIGKVGNTGTVWVAGAQADTNSWINLTGALGANSVNSGTINDGTITNDDIAAGANIAASKLNLSGPTLGALTVQTNATVGGTLNVTGVMTLGATQLNFSAAGVAGPTNQVVADGVGIRVNVNGTNLILRATRN